MRVERDRGADEGTRTLLLGLALLVVGFLGFGGGYLVGSDETPSEPVPITGPVERSPSPTPTVPPSPTLGPDVELLADGRYFVDVSAVADGPPAVVSFDLAYLLRGPQARQAAADHGDVIETDEYVLNDDQLVRELPVSPVVQVSYVPETACCTLQPGAFEPWADAINEEIPNDYAGSDAWWWITVRAGEIVRIEEQLLASDG